MSDIPIFKVPDSLDYESMERRRGVRYKEGINCLKCTWSLLKKCTKNNDSGRALWCNHGLGKFWVNSDGICENFIRRK